MRRDLVRAWKAGLIALNLLMFGQFPRIAIADGNETLGPPAIPIASGTGVVAAGVGTVEGQPGSIDIDVPGDVQQVLLYWNGQMPQGMDGDSTVIVNGVDVTGTLIGGVLLLPPDAFSSSFRADITDLGLVEPGMNTLVVEGLDFTKVNNGAGVLVIFDDGTGTADIQVRDGLDLAFLQAPEPLRSTVPQAYRLNPAAVDRVGSLSMFLSSLQASETSRPSSIRVFAGSSAGVSSRTVDFEDVDLGSDPFSGRLQFVSRGFRFTNSGELFVIDDPTACSGPVVGAGDCADNGTQTQVSLDSGGAFAGGPIVITEEFGRPFNLLQLDLAEGIYSGESFPSATEIVATGRTVDGGTIVESFALDGVIDATGPLVDFETFATTDLATAELVTVTLSSIGPSSEGDGSFSLDNIVAVVAEGAVTLLSNPLNSSDGPDWDTLTIPVNVPMGADTVVVQVLSEDDEETGELPASLAWTAAALSVVDEPPEPEQCMIAVEKKCRVISGHGHSFDKRSHRKRRADQFGDACVIYDKDGGIVKYTFEITNVGNTDIENITVIDDVLGELRGSPIDYLGVGESVKLSTEKKVRKDITNTVTVTGNTVGATTTCEAVDYASVTIRRRWRR